MRGTNERTDADVDGGQGGNVYPLSCPLLRTDRQCFVFLGSALAAAQRRRQREALLRRRKIRWQQKGGREEGGRVIKKPK